MSPIADQTVTSYLARLASGDAVPGGGAAVAITAAQAVALLAMVVAVTDKANAIPGTRDTTDTLARMRMRFLDLATEDGEVFGAVMDVYKLPTSTDAEKKARQSKMQAALKEAARVPLAVLDELNTVYPLMAKVVDGAKPSIASDAALAVQLVDAAVKGASYNVRINLKYLNDPEFKASTLAQLERLTSERRARRKAFMKKLALHF